MAIVGWSYPAAAQIGAVGAQETAGSTTSHPLNLFDLVEQSDREAVPNLFDLAGQQESEATPDLLDLAERSNVGAAELEGDRQVAPNLFDFVGGESATSVADKVSQQPAIALPSAEPVSISDSAVTRTPSEASTAAIAVPAPTPTPAVPADIAISPPSEGVNPEELGSSSVGVSILNLRPGSILDVPATSVIVQYPEGRALTLQVNGKTVDANQIGRTETDAQTGTVTQTWYSVVVEGDRNIIEVVSADGQVLASTVVFLRGAPTSIHLSSDILSLQADGRSTATLVGELMDDSGNRSNHTATVTLNASAGEFVGNDIDPSASGFQVQAERGQFMAELRAGLTAEMIAIQATSNQLQASLQLEQKAFLRPSIATGSINLRVGARGTDFFDSFRDFLPLDEDNSNAIDLDGAVFATGRVGEWLFTGAYNSERSLNEDGDGVESLSGDTQFSEQVYQVYGDSSTTERTFSSGDRVFLRFERSSPVRGAEADYIQWGNFSTDEFSLQSQEFSAVNRNLHGLSANYTLGNFQVSGFFSRDTDGFERDAIAPDGTSGFYFLSNRLLVPGSEDIVFELEEQLRPGTAIERVQLRRDIDYFIDYDRGTILFRGPVLRKEIADDGTVLVRRIVATYQFESAGGDDTDLFGVRTRYHFSRIPGRESWVGATYLQENQGLRDFELFGADAYISLGDDGHVIAEYAQSTNASDLASVDGDAYRIEVQKAFGDSVVGRAYFREASEGFSNDATVSFVPGQRRYGVDLQARVAENTFLNFGYDREDNFGVAPVIPTGFEDLFGSALATTGGTEVDNSLTTISAGVQQILGPAVLNLDYNYRDRVDRLGDLSATSSQLSSRISYQVTDRITLRALNDLMVSNNTDVAFPDRTQVGIDYAIADGLTVGLSQTWYTNGQFAGQSFTSLDVTGERHLFANTSAYGRYSLVGGSSAAAQQAAIGLNSNWTVAPGLYLDLAYERTFTGSFLSGAGESTAVPFLTGQTSGLGFDSGNSYAVSLEYTDNPNFNASIGLQRSDNTSGSNTVLSAAASGKLSPALTALMSFERASATTTGPNDLDPSTNFRLGFAYRNPNSDRFNLLARYEFRDNPSTIPDTLLLGSGTGSRDHLLVTEAIYAPVWNWEFYGKAGVRYSTTDLAEDFSASSQLYLTQARATHRFGFRWDASVEGRFITQPTASFSEYGYTAELGYHLTPDLRLAVGYSGGGAFDRDFSTERTAGGFFAGINFKVNELFGGFGRQDIAPPQQQESQIQFAREDGSASEAVAQEENSEAIAEIAAAEVGGEEE